MNQKTAPQLLNEKELEEELIKNFNSLPDARHVVYQQYCLTNGTIVVDSRNLDMPFCDNPECTNCRFFHETLALLAETFTDTNLLEEEKELIIDESDD